MAIVLVGFMGAGKSTVARLLADDFIDLDVLIESQIQQPIADLFAKSGEAEFRKIETACLEKALAAGKVLATGGGIVERSENRKLLKKAKQVVYLQADFEALQTRILADAVNVRPLAQDGLEALRERFLRRQAWYLEVSDLVVETSQVSAEEVAARIKQHFDNENEKEMKK